MTRALLCSPFSGEVGFCGLTPSSLSASGTAAMYTQIKKAQTRKSRESCFSVIVAIFCYQSVIRAVVIGDSSWGNAGYYRRWLSLSVILSPTFLSSNKSIGSFKATKYYCIDGTGSLLSSCVQMVNAAWVGKLLLFFLPCKSFLSKSIIKTEEKTEEKFL